MGHQGLNSLKGICVQRRKCLEQWEALPRKWEGGCMVGSGGVGREAEIALRIHYARLLKLESQVQRRCRTADSFPKNGYATTSVATVGDDGANVTRY